LKGGEGNGLIKGDGYETYHEFVQCVNRHWVNHCRDACGHRIVSRAHFKQYPSRASAHDCTLSFAGDGDAALSNAHVYNDAECATRSYDDTRANTSALWI
jgi:hypothetical protein